MQSTTKGRKAAYWITTGLLAAGMLSGGIAQLLRTPSTTQGIVHLGYPVYIMTILASWKILGVAVLLLPRLTLVKEWAYAGFFFLMTGATISHLASGDKPGEVTAQVIFVVLIVLSWYLRPANRRLAAITNLPD
nr:DoxX family protein [uncultured Chitinophaga sp.]